MEATVILEGLGGELDRAMVKADNDEALSAEIKRAMAEWFLSPGDTIRVVDADD